MSPRRAPKATRRFIITAISVGAFWSLASCGAEAAPAPESASTTAITTAATAVTTTRPPAPTQVTPVPLPPGACRVTEVEDGDTIEVADCAEAGVIRLLLVDAPETGSDCYADEARDELRRRLLNQPVRLEADARDRDQYDRRLRYVWLGDELVNEWLARDGFARLAVYESTGYLDRVAAAEKAAQSAGRGLWGECVAGNCDGPVVISGLDKQGEVVTLTGEGVDLTGWSIHSEKGAASGQRFTFPKGFVITGSVEVVSGATRFANSAGRLWWTKESYWNNSDDDDALLFNPANKLACEFDDGQ